MVFAANGEVKLPVVIPPQSPTMQIPLRTSPVGSRNPSSCIDVEQPPGAANSSIGSRGSPSGDGTFDATGAPVVPTSLYLAQPCERLGPSALAAIGFAPQKGRS